MWEFQGCHFDIEKSLNELGLLSDAPAPIGRAKMDVVHALEVFDKTIYTHHSDEEKILFPLVERRAIDDEERARVHELALELTIGHREIERLWSRLMLNVRLFALGHEVQFDKNEIEELIGVYHAQTVKEEEVYMPLAKEVLKRHDEGLEVFVKDMHTHHLNSSETYFYV